MRVPKLGALQEAIVLLPIQYVPGAHNIHPLLPLAYFPGGHTLH